MARNPSFTKSIDGEFRADITVRFRLSKEILTNVLSNAIALGFCESDELLSDNEVWSIIRKVLKDVGSNALILYGENDVSDWAKKRIDSL